MKNACTALPMLSCDFTVKKELRCKGESKPMAESTFDGFFEIPVLILILAALSLGVMMSACTCGALTLCKCKKHRGRR